jgi:hypothetical protein
MVLLPLSIGSSVMGVRFEAEGAGLTESLVHSHLGKHGGGVMSAETLLVILVVGLHVKESREQGKLTRHRPCSA